MKPSFLPRKGLASIPSWISMFPALVLLSACNETVSLQRLPIRSDGGSLQHTSSVSTAPALLAPPVNGANVKTYGAVGDGKTDDTTAIQQAIGFANRNGLAVYFPAGTYSVIPGALPEINVGIHAPEAFIQAINGNDGPLLTVNYDSGRRNTNSSPSAYDVQIGGLIGYYQDGSSGTGLWVKQSQRNRFTIRQTNWLKYGVHVDTSWKNGGPMPAIFENNFWIKTDSGGVGLQITTNNDAAGVPIDANKFYLGSSFNHFHSLVRVDAGTTLGNSDVHNNIFEMDLLEIGQPNSSGIVLSGLAHDNQFIIHNQRGVNGAGVYGRVDPYAAHNLWRIPLWIPDNWDFGASPQLILATTPQNTFQTGDSTNLFGMEPRSDGGSIGGVGAANLVRIGGWYKDNAVSGSSIQFHAQGPNGQRGSISFSTKNRDDNSQPTVRAVIDQYGNFGIGNIAPLYTLDVTGTLRVAGQAYTNSGNGSFSILSDARYKDVRGPFERGLDAILSVDTVRFKYLPGNPLGSDPAQEYIGVTAQNLQKVLPEAVKREKDGYLTVNTSPVLWALINAIKEFHHHVTVRFDSEARSIASKADQAEIVQVKAENAALKARVERAERERAEIKARLDRVEEILRSK